MVWAEGGVHGVQGLGGRDENFVFYCKRTRRGDVEPHLGLEMPSLAAEARRADGGVRWGAGCEGRAGGRGADTLPPFAPLLPRSLLSSDSYLQGPGVAQRQAGMGGSAGMRTCPPRERDCYLPALGEYPEPVSGTEEDARVDR